MIEVSCGKCGAVQSIEAASVPAGGKVIKCSSCGRLVRVPGAKRGQDAAAGKRKAAPNVELGPSGTNKPEAPAAPAVPSIELGFLSKAKEEPELSLPKPAALELGRTSEAGLNLPPPKPVESFELGFLSKPKDEDEVPLPKPASLELGRTSEISDIGVPAPRGAESLELGHLTAPAEDEDDIESLEDIESLDGELEADELELIDEPGLPAPKAASAPGHYGAIPGYGEDDADLPAPAGFYDDDVVDLPAPLPADDDVVDLPAPLQHGSHEDTADLFAAAANVGQDDALDLPAPAGFFDDAPGPSQNALDLPAPAGFFDDAPGPSQNALDLPAPAGFFDDAPGQNALDFPLGDSPDNALDLPLGGSPADSGMVDLSGLDLGNLSLDDPTLGMPEPAQSSGAPAADAGGLDFMNIGLGESGDESGGMSLDLGLPGADDAPGASPMSLDLGLPGADDASPMSLDLGLLGADGAPGASPMSLDLGLPGADDASPMSLDFGLPEPSDGTSPLGALGSTDSSSLGDTDFMDLGLPETDSSGDAGSMPLDFGLPDPPDADAPPARKSAVSMDISLPSLASGGGDAAGPSSMDLGLPKVHLKGIGDKAGKDKGKAKAGKQPGGDDGLGLPKIDVSGKSSGNSDKKQTKMAATAARLARANDDEELSLEVDESALRENAPKGVVVGGVVVDGTTGAALDAQPGSPAKPDNSRRNIIVAVVAALVLGLGGGGFYMFNKWQGEKERVKKVAENLSAARNNMFSDLGGHWARAGKSAAQALALDSANPEALGLAAQAYYAAYLDEGTPEAQKQLGEGSNYIKRINELAVQGPDVDKAQALKSIVEARPARAIDLLNGVLEASQAPDEDATLYLGWAHEAADNYQKALKYYGDALKSTERRKLPALYGLGRSQLELGMAAEARESFAKIKEIDPEHIGALLGNAEAAEVADQREREALYLAVLKRDNLDKVDRRVVSRAWRLAGTAALRAGRLDEAKARFDKALEANDSNLDAQLGLARVALAQERPKDAQKLLEDILKVEPDHVGASITTAELAFHEKQSEEAQTIITKLIEREESIHARAERSTVHFLRAQILTAQVGKEATTPEQKQLVDDTVAAYRKAVEFADDSNIRPAVALAEFLTRFGRSEEARDTLNPVRAKAATDPALAFTLGQVYFKSGALLEAEEWFRKTLDMRPDDSEAQYQLGLVLRALGREDEALAAIAKAFEADKSRADIGVELAVTYEVKGRDKDALAIYEELLKAGDPLPTLLEKSGRFFVRTGKPERAKDLGEQLLKLQSSNPVGMYLLGEGLYAAADYENAFRSFRDALRIDIKPEYLEAQGRAAEKLNNHDEALRSYIQAIELDKTYMAPRIGEARVRVNRRDYDKARAVLKKALEVNATSADVYHYLGVCDQEQGEVKKSVEHYQRALRYDGRNAETHYRLGQAYYDLSKLREAAASLDRATRLAEPSVPWLGKAYLNLGYAYRALGNRRGAIDAWEEFLALGTGSEAETREIQRLLMGLKAQ